MREFVTILINKDLEKFEYTEVVFKNIALVFNFNNYDVSHLYFLSKNGVADSIIQDDFSIMCWNNLEFRNFLTKNNLQCDYIKHTEGVRFKKAPKGIMNT